MPNCVCILSHKNVLQMESNAFRKSIKQAKVHLPMDFLPSRMVFRVKNLMVLAATALTETILLLS